MNTILLKQALIGTDRPLTPNSLEENPDRIEAIESLGETILSDSAPWRLLLKAGCYAIAERAGFEPEFDTDSRPGVSLHDDALPMNPKIVDLLLGFFKEYQDLPQVMLHLFRKLEEKRLVFPAETLPRFLDALSQRRMFKEEGHDMILNLLGERGRWLAGKNPDWRWASDGPIDEASADTTELEEIWNEGTYSERKTTLRILAEHSPVMAKRLLAESWKNEKAEHREAFLNLLSASFDESNIEFLEDALKDRSASIRRTAATLLARLPDSDYAQRTRERAEGILVPGPKPKTLQIKPPTEFTKSMKADGLDEKPPRGVGEKAWWISEALCRVPLIHWEKRFQIKPQELLAALSKDDDYPSVLYAWTSAVQWFSGHDH